jgi:alkanesulfonate monooxygenase SsuD/methylene tetrahydromethanopterin reductase-like flavin-dependent oxidoreductase (luciferase family)
MRFDTYSVIDVPPGDDPVGERIPAVNKIRDTMDQFVASESMGFTGAWIAEHHFGGEAVSGSLAVLLSHLAARTTTLRVGTAACILPLHQPIRAAEDFAAVDVLSNGRLDFGMGVGNRARETLPFGIQPETCRPRFFEAYEIIKRAWTEDVFDFKGEFYEAHSVSVLPKPVQQPTPPLYQPVMSPSSMDWVAGEGIIPMSSANPNNIKSFLDRYRAALLDNGKTEQEIKAAIGKIYWQVFTYVSPSQQEARERGPEHHADWFNTCVRADRWGAERLGIDLDSPWSVLSVGSALGAGGGGQLATGDGLWNARQSMSGDPKFCIDWVTELRELGVEHLAFVCNLGTTSHDEVMRTLKLLSDEVIPHFE